jgi:hypothetical protein
MGWKVGVVMCKDEWFGGTDETNDEMQVLSQFNDMMRQRVRDCVLYWWYGVTRVLSGGK